MIPVLGPDAIREADEWTIVHEPIDSWALMERAASACTERLIPGLLKAGSPHVVVVAGMGNNGGDGLAMARLLRGKGFDVSAVRVRHRSGDSADNARNAQLLVADGIRFVEVDSMRHWPDIPADAWYIDALIGSGLNAPLGGIALEVVRLMNNSGRTIVSVDIPSGLFAESNAGNDIDSVVHADRTLSLELPKLAFLLPEFGECAGEWELVPIGLDRDFLKERSAEYQLFERVDARQLLPQRLRFAHKGSFGHALLIAGSEGRMGAAVLAAMGCLRSGTGLVSVHVPSVGRDVIQSAVPAAMCIPDAAAKHISSIPEPGPFNAIGVGPGLGTREEVAQALEQLAIRRDSRLVLDADALNILSEHRVLLGGLPPDTILTPHPKEFDRLAGRTFTSGFERLQEARSCAVRWRSIIVLKGAWTAICAPDGNVVFNTTGNPGMAKGGSGDVLTGLLTGLLASGLDPFDACTLGTYLHGSAGDIAAARIGMDGMTAEDIAQAIPHAWEDLRSDS